MAGRATRQRPSTPPTLAAVLAAHGGRRPRSTGRSPARAARSRSGPADPVPVLRSWPVHARCGCWRCRASRRSRRRHGLPWRDRGRGSVHDGWVSDSPARRSAARRGSPRCRSASPAHRLGHRQADRRQAGRAGRRRGAGPHRRAAVQGARRAQGRGDEVRPGAQRLRGRRCPRSWPAPYRATLTKLQDAAPPLPAATVHKVLAERARTALAARVRRVRRHARPPRPRSVRCTGRSGRTAATVAVKIQYPGAGEALISDLNQLSRAARLGTAWIPGLEIGPILDELKAADGRGARLHRRGASGSRPFAEAFADDDEFAVPDGAGLQRARDRLRVAGGRAAVAG